MKSSFHKTIATPIVLLALSIIAYGVLIPWLGFYWDDWPTIWYYHFLGPNSFINVFSIDRPFLGWLFTITTRIMQESPLAWQSFGIFTRWLTGFSMWLFLIALFPKSRSQNIWIAMLFIIYPGFRQQYISVTYSHVFILLSLILLSFATMLWAIRKPKWFYPLILISIFLSGFTLFSVEYFFGMELLRPLILWISFSETIKDTNKRIRKVLKLWLPYLIILAVFLYWRIFIHETPRAQISIFDQIKTNPFEAIFHLITTVFSDIFEVTVSAWGQTIDIRWLRNFPTSYLLIGFALILVTISAVILFLSRSNDKSNHDVNSQNSLLQTFWHNPLIWFGFIALLTGGIPFWVTTLEIKLHFPKDRFTLAMIFGITILIVGLLEWLPIKRKVKIWIIALLIGFSVNSHFLNATTYKNEWTMQKEFFWQLSWRAPGIQKNTTLLTNKLPFNYYSDNSLTAPLNWIYAPAFESGSLPYLMYTLESRYGNSLTQLKKGAPIEQPYRAVAFSGSTSQILGFTYTPPTCLKIITKENVNTIPSKPFYVRKALSLSDPSLILTNIEPAIPPTKFFSPEPVHNWCYYYQKAELARQQGNWDEVLQIGEIALQEKENLSNVDPIEFLPFIEAFINNKQWDQAANLTLFVYQKASKSSSIFCELWGKINETNAGNTLFEKYYSKVEDHLKCSY